MKWGLVPSYFKDQSQGGKMFNCRAESLAEGRAVWSGPKKHNRCLVFMEGYYEWEKEGPKNKIPHYIKRKDGKLMCMAGLWDRNTKGGDELYSFTIITTGADEGIKWLHERMPVILDPEDDLINQWLDPNLIWKENSSEFVKLIKPYPTSKLDVYEVSSDVNKIGGDSPKMNQPVKVSARKGPASSFFQKKKAVKGESRKAEEVKVEGRAEDAPKLEPKGPKEEQKGESNEKNNIKKEDEQKVKEEKTVQEESHEKQEEATNETFEDNGDTTVTETSEGEHDDGNQVKPPEKKRKKIAEKPTPTKRQKTEQNESPSKGPSSHTRSHDM